MIDLKDMNNLDTDQNKLECIKVFIGSLNFGLHTNQFVTEDFTFVTHFHRSWPRFRLLRRSAALRTSEQSCYKAES